MNEMRMLGWMYGVTRKDKNRIDPSGRNQSHVGRVRFPLRAEMHGRAHITDSCFIAFITSNFWVQASPGLPR